jgi:DNA-binding Lrp family transcriptional regulator
MVMLYKSRSLVDGAQDHVAQNNLTRKSLGLLRFFWESGSRRTVYTIGVKQSEIASKLDITRQALSIHVRRLRDMGLIQIGRGFVNVTEAGLRTLGIHSNPAIVLVKMTPQRRASLLEEVRTLPIIEFYRVTGEVDFVVLVEQQRLDEFLQALSGKEGVIETRTLISIDALNSG